MPSLHITIVAVGRLKEKYWVDACEEYLKRLSRYAKLQVLEVNDLALHQDNTVDSLLKAEAELLIQRIPAGSYQVALDSSGKQLSSERLADFIVERQNTGVNQISFILGGSWGIDSKLKASADTLLSFGAITLPHSLARVVLLEQLYRCFRIIHGAPYHK